MAQSDRIIAGFRRVATEFKTLRSEIGTARAVRVTRAQYAQLTNKDGVTMYLITDWSANGPIADSFTRANSATAIGLTSPGNYPWSTYGAIWGIDANQAYRPSATSGVGVLYQDLGTVEHYVEARFAVTGAGSMIVGRMTDADNYTGLAFYADGTRGIFRSVAGTQTQITLVSGNIDAIQAGDLIRLSFKGNLCTISQNGNAIGTFNDTTQGTKNGLRATSNVARFKDYKTDVT